MKQAFSKYDYRKNKTMKTSGFSKCLRRELQFHPSVEEIAEMIELLEPNVHGFIKYKNFRKLVKYLASDDYFSKYFIMSGSTFWDLTFSEPSRFRKFVLRLLLLISNLDY